MHFRHAILLAVLACFTASSVQASTGTLTFLGEIKQETCQLNLQLKTVSADCPTANKTYQYPVRSTGKVSKLPVRQGIMNITWLDNAHKKGIVTTTYR